MSDRYLPIANPYPFPTQGAHAKKSQLQEGYQKDYINDNADQFNFLLCFISYINICMTLGHWPKMLPHGHLLVAALRFAGRSKSQTVTISSSYLSQAVFRTLQLLLNPLLIMHSRNCELGN
jgi:hypothetical protein